ncbi:hypothetical protein BpPP18_01650 [Weizmannia acidilactici]|nr:hypothetical protein BpPP18_01650 [Weizmannia acidilactici]
MPLIGEEAKKFAGRLDAQLDKLDSVDAMDIRPNSNFKNGGSNLLASFFLPVSSQFFKATFIPSRGRGYYKYGKWAE